MGLFRENQPYEDQPFFVINDEAYDRMLQQLQSGESHVWSYKNICPCSRKKDCRCTKHKNILNAEGKMVRVIGGVQKPVLRSSELIAMYQVVGGPTNRRAVGLGQVVAEVVDSAGKFR